MKCADCHSTELFPKDKDNPEPNKPLELLNLPGIDNCRQCHAARSRPAGSDQAFGGVRHGCVDCHRYHNGDHALDGPGSSRREPRSEQNRLEAAEMLRGIGTKRESP
jgi:ribosomal protein L40E